MTRRRRVCVGVGIALLASCGNEVGGREGEAESEAESESEIARRCDLSFADDGDVRVFAVGERVDLESAETLDAWRGAVMDRFDRTIAPCLSTSRPNLVVYPENAALPALFTGSWGQMARKATTMSGALSALLAAYDSPAEYYRDRFGEIPDEQMALLAATDTQWRALAVYGELAATHGSWVVVAGNVADAALADDPSVVKALRNPEFPSGPVWLATERSTGSRAVLWGPDGTVTASIAAVYPPDAPAPFGATSGLLEDLAPIETPFGSLGVVTSRDAWMPDVNERYAILGVKVLVFPAALRGWTSLAPGVPDGWPPDVFKESGWNNVQKFSGLQFAVASACVGNLFDVSFDGQVAIAKDARPDDEPLGFVGQEPDVGFLAIGGWSGDDASADRSDLQAQGEDFCPGGARAGEQRPSLVAADLSLDEFASDEADDSAKIEEVAGCTSRPSVSATDDGLFIACEDGLGGVRLLHDGVEAVAAEGRSPALSGGVMAWVSPLGDVRVVAADGSVDATIDGEDTWLPDVAIDGNQVLVAYVDRDGQYLTWVAAAPDFAPQPADPTAATHAYPDGNQWSPAVAVRADRVAVAYAEFADASWDVFLVESSDGGATLGSPRRIDDAGNAHHRLHADVDLAFDSSDRLWAAWTDLRDGRGDTDVRWAMEPFEETHVSEEAEGASAWRPALGPAPHDPFALSWQELQDGTNDMILGNSLFGEDYGEVESGDQWTPRVAVGPHGNGFLVWEDSRLGGRRVRMRNAFSYPGL